MVAAAEAFAQAERSDELRARLARAYEDFRGQVAAGIQRSAGAGGAAPGEDVLALSSTLIALFDGLALQWLIEPERTFSAEEVLASLAAIGRLAAGSAPPEA